MILVDTSVWIDYLNGADNGHTATLDTELIQGKVAISDVIYLEILQGIKNDKEYEITRTRLQTLDRYEMFGNRMVEPCAQNYRALRKRGLTVRSTLDVVIATFCIKNNMPLLFKDKDYIPFVDYLGLTAVPLGT